VAALAGVIGLAVAFVRNTGTAHNAPLRNERASPAYSPPATRPLSRAELAAAKATAYDFIRTAVRREHLEESWPLVTPALRQGLTRAQWLTGEIPVVPYPADLRHLTYEVEYSYPAVLGLGVALLPTAGHAERPTVFRIELVERSRWLVASWGTPGASMEQIEGRAAAAIPPSQRVAAAEQQAPGLSPLWLALPAGIVALALLLPAALGIRGWSRSRREQRAYRASRES
jgi:hypothetical protein